MTEGTSKAAAGALTEARDPRPSSPREIEVKLEGEPDLLRRLFTLDAFVGATQRPRAQNLVTTYFDTKDDALDREGLALRIRKTGARRIMTLNWTTRGEGPFSRRGAQASVQSDEPDPTPLGAEIAALVNDAIGGEALIPCFVARVRRRSGDLTLGSARVAIAIDEGKIIAGERHAPIAECEIELKAGEAAALFAFAARLTQEGLRLCPAQQSQHGHRLARGGEPAEVRVIHPNLYPEASVEDAISAVVKLTLEQFLGNWPALLETDLPESIHQMRVALRRLRSGLALFEKSLPNAGFEPFRAEAKRIASGLGPAREQDAFVAIITEGPLGVFERDDSFDELFSASAARRARAYADARRLILAPETSRFVLDLQSFVARRGWRNGLGTEDLSKLGQPAPSFAAEALERLDRRARKRGKGLVALAPEQRHCVRIALKNLRYGADFFASLFDNSRCAKSFVKRLGGIQDALGSYNDAIVAHEIVATLEHDAGPAASRAAGIVLGWCGHCASASDDPLRDSWRAYRKARRFWR